MNKYEGNNKYIYEELKDRNTKLNIYWITKNKVLSTKNVNIIYSYSFKGIYLIIKAKKYFITTSINEIIDGLYIDRNDWIYYSGHGIPVKCVGSKSKYFSKREKKKQISYFSKIKYVFSSSEYVDDLLKDVFKIKDSQLLRVGFPKNDYIINGKNNKNILYAPTFRPNQVLNLNNLIELKSLNTFLSRHEYKLIIRLHPLDISNIEILEKGNFSNIKLDYNDEVQETLKLTEILITDYSSIAFDFIVKNKPIIFYIYDYKEYKKETGLLFNYNQMPGYKCYKWNEVMLALNSIIKKEDKFKDEREEWIALLYDKKLLGNSIETICKMLDNK